MKLSEKNSNSKETIRVDRRFDRSKWQERGKCAGHMTERLIKTSFLHSLSSLYFGNRFSVCPLKSLVWMFLRSKQKVFNFQLNLELMSEPQTTNKQIYRSNVEHDHTSRKDNTHNINFFFCRFCSHSTPF